MSDYQKLSHQVRERDDYRCLGCGANTTHMRWWSIQHRLARGQGGTNTLPNMVTLCGSATSPGCHLLCEQRDADMLSRGLWLRSHQVPAEEPVVLWTGAAYYLTPDGGYRELHEIPGYTMNTGTVCPREPGCINCYACRPL